MYVRLCFRGVWEVRIDCRSKLVLVGCVKLQRCGRAWERTNEVPELLPARPSARAPHRGLFSSTRLKDRQEREPLELRCATGVTNTFLSHAPFATSSNIRSLSCAMFSLDANGRSFPIAMLDSSISCGSNAAYSAFSCAETVAGASPLTAAAFSAGTRSRCWSCEGTDLVHRSSCLSRFHLDLELSDVNARCSSCYFEQRVVRPASALVGSNTKRTAMGNPLLLEVRQRLRARKSSINNVSRCSLDRFHLSLHW
jgi:hypothetical protein